MADPFAPRQSLTERFQWPDDTVLQDGLRDLTRAVEADISTLRSISVDWKTAIDSVTELGINRIDEVITPRINEIIQLSQLGFLKATSSSSITLAEDQNRVFIITAGPERDLFAPTAFVAITRIATANDFAIARVLDYDRIGGALNVEISRVYGNPGPHNDWEISASGGVIEAAYRWYDIAKLNDPQALSDAMDEVQGYASTASAAAAQAQTAAAAAASFNPSNYVGAVQYAGDQTTVSTNIGNLGTSITALSGDIANRVRFDAAQALTPTQKAQVFSNINRTPVAKADATTPIIIDDRERIVTVSGTVAWTLGHTVTAAQAGNGFKYLIRNTGSIVVTIDPAGTETIDGLTTLKCCPKQDFWVVCDGTNWYTIGRRKHLILSTADVTATVSTVDFFLPPGYDCYQFECTGIGQTVNDAFVTGRLAFDAAGTVFNTTNNYRYGYVWGGDNNYVAGASVAATYWELSAIGYSGLYTSLIDLDFDPGSTAKYPTYLSKSYGAGSANEYSMVVGGNCTAAAQRVNGFRFLLTSGQFTRGQFFLSGRTLQ